MDEKIVIVLISAGFAAFINSVFQLLNKMIDKYMENKKEEKIRLKEYREKKEKIYIVAIDRLLQIRRGFEFTHIDVLKNKELQEEIKNNNLDYLQTAAQLRLYSNDKIYNQYKKLIAFYVYAYAHENAPRLFEDSKWAYDIQITILARQMQEDLGYRKYNSSYDTIICPECAVEHDMITKCPNCGMSYEELINNMDKTFKESLENNFSQKL